MRTPVATASTLFLDFGVILLVAGLVALLFYYLRQPVILGYLLAGFFVGPFSPGPSFVSDVEVMTFLGELGIVFLLFALGLEFNLRKLRKVGAVAIIAGTVEITIMLALGYGIGRALGWGTLESIFLGAIISISSTTVIVKVLAELGKKDEDWAQTAFGILIIEDVLAVLILTALSSAGATGNFAPDEIVGLLYKLGVFLGAALLLGLLAAPRIVDRLAILKVEEITVILATGIGFGMALLAAGLGFSAGLGAFVAGALMAESPRVARIEEKIHPLRDVFTAIFFVTVGAALDPGALVANWRTILVVALAVVGGKIFAVTLGTFLTGAPPGKALRVGMTLAQIGEFGFIIAALGLSIGAANPAIYAIAIAVSAISSFLTPYLVRGSPAIVAALDRRLPSGLRAYASAYSTWVRRLGRSDRASPEWKRIRINVLTATLNAAVIISLFALGATLGDSLRAALAPFGLRFGGVEWILVSLASTPFAYMWVREVHHVIVDLARLAVPQRLRGAECTNTEFLLRRTFGFAATVVTALACVVVGGLFVEDILYVLVVAGIGILAGSVVLGRSLRRFHDEVEKTIDRMTGTDAPPAASREEALHMIDHAHAWGAGSREVRLPTVSGAGGRTIGQLRLRELTGASVVSVRHAGDAQPIANPGPGFGFRAGDRVHLVGDDASLTRAEEVLLGLDLGVEGGATEVVVPPAHAGKRLRDLSLGAAQVLVVRRADTANAAVPEMELAEGDVLVLLGSDAEIEAARAQLDS